VAENYISKDSPKRKEVDNMFRVIEEAPTSLIKLNMERKMAKEVAKVERKMAKEVAKVERKMAKATAEKVVKASNLGWSKEEILELFEMSVEQAQQILDKD
ncbi:MAG: hypothetical protein FWG63_04880, partial [Defluviitaleaceae bacterium]|nr:hypothetical protein [Defluviitaleaceae bacterium]